MPANSRWDLIQRLRVKLIIFYESHPVAWCDISGESRVMNINV